MRRRKLSGNTGVSEQMRHKSVGEQIASGDMPEPEVYWGDEDINSADFLDKFIEQAEAASRSYPKEGKISY